MASSLVCARIDQQLKREVEEVLAAIGLTLSGAFRLMLIRVARDKVLPFEPIFPDPEPIQERNRMPSVVITPEMRHHAVARTYDHHGFLGFRAAIARLYARPEGATQDEVNQVARALGSPQVGYINMLHQAKKWGHVVVSWNDPSRGGKVHKLIYNPGHGARSTVDPPANWEEMNVPKVPPGVIPTPFMGRRKALRRRKG
jgi:addiction module RelB/DinJ family antitoxin